MSWRCSHTTAPPRLAGCDEQQAAAVGEDTDTHTTLSICRTTELSCPRKETMAPKELQQNGYVIESNQGYQ